MVQESRSRERTEKKRGQSVLHRRMMKAVIVCTDWEAAMKLPKSAAMSRVWMRGERTDHIVALEGNHIVHKGELQYYDYSIAVMNALF